MGTRIRIALLSGLLALSAFLVAPTSYVSADSSGGGEKCKDGFYEYAGVCFPEETGLSELGVKEILEKFGVWLFSVLGVIAVILFVICGIQYLLSAGDDKKLERAKLCMTYSLMGVVVALGALVIIFAVDALLGGRAGNGSMRFGRFMRFDTNSQTFAGRNPAR
jgi:amino acid transporter